MRQPAKWVLEYDPDQHWPEVPFGNGLTVQILWLVGRGQELSQIRRQD